MANYRIVSSNGIFIGLRPEEVEDVLDWTEEDVTRPDGTKAITHLQRKNTRTGEWKTLIAWDKKFLVIA